MHWAFEQLGLPADADARAVKRAYAQRLKTTRPDEDPQGFQRLHEAYEAALAQVRGSQRPPAPWRPDAPADRGSAGDAAGSQPTPGPETSADPPRTDARPNAGRSADVAGADAAPPPIAVDRWPGAAPPVPAFPSPFPPPSQPRPNVRIHFGQDWHGTFDGGARAPRPDGLQGAPGAPSAPSLDPAPPLLPRRFAKALAERAAASTPDELARWLTGHEGLYDLTSKTALVVPLIRELDRRLSNGKGALGKAHLDAVLAFFGLDQVNETREYLKAELERLERAAKRQGQEIDWNRVLSERGNASPPRYRPPPIWHGIPPSVFVFLLIIVLHALRACSQHGA